MSNENRIVKLLDQMWQDYLKLNPQAGEIFSLFQREGEKVVNDHIALRTFNDKRIGVDHLAQSFLACGYQEKGDYEFTEKKLFAKHFEHPNQDLPKIFISELKIEEFSESLQEIVIKLIDQISTEDLKRFDLVSMGRPWSIDSETYEKLMKESEYAAWLSAFGFRPNHFTVFVNKLNKFQDLGDLNKFLKGHGFKLNASGGEIKGSPDVYLEQSSTMAGSIDVVFSDKTLNIPACYYEFAKRYPLQNGELYQGFVAKSADKIFESTNQST